MDVCGRVNLLVNLWMSLQQIYLHHMTLFSVTFGSLPQVQQKISFRCGYHCASGHDRSVLVSSAALLGYLAVWPPVTAPPLSFSYGTNLIETKADCFPEPGAPGSTGVDSSQYSGHSFRIATAAKLGMSDS